MKIIVWLWNPWNEYKNTRHNVWFLFIDYFQNKYNFESFKIDKKFNIEMSTWTYNWEKIILVKPLTFMNLSWQSILKLMSFYKIVKDDIVIISDDTSMNFWKIRFRDKWSAGWHNWLKSIIQQIWEEFKRIKIWVWFDTKYELSNWVLWNFSEEEQNNLDDTFLEVEKILIEKFL